MIITYDDAEAAVNKLNNESTLSYYWDGWTICEFKAAPAAIYDKDGSYHSMLGWGFLTKYDVDKDGQWHIDN